MKILFRTAQIFPDCFFRIFTGFWTLMRVRFFFTFWGFFTITLIFYSYSEFFPAGFYIVFKYLLTICLFILFWKCNSRIDNWVILITFEFKVEIGKMFPTNCQFFSDYFLSFRISHRIERWENVWKFLRNSETISTREYVNFFVHIFSQIKKSNFLLIFHWNRDWSILIFL